jgi:hypothetical protein
MLRPPRRAGAVESGLPEKDTAITLFEVLPYLEELWRDWRANPGRLVPPKGQTNQVALAPVD